MKIKFLPLVLMLSFFSLKGVAMTFLFFGGDKVEAVIFSPLDGQITFEGKPASGAKIKLWLAWKDQEGESEYFTADEHGRFSYQKEKLRINETHYHKYLLAKQLVSNTRGKKL